MYQVINEHFKSIYGEEIKIYSGKDEYATKEEMCKAIYLSFLESKERMIEFPSEGNVRKTQIETGIIQSDNGISIPVFCIKKDRESYSESFQIQENGKNISFSWNMIQETYLQNEPDPYRRLLPGDVIVIKDGLGEELIKVWYTGFDAEYAGSSNPMGMIHFGENAKGHMQMITPHNFVKEPVHLFLKSAFVPETEEEQERE